MYTLIFNADYVYKRTTTSVCALSLIKRIMREHRENDKKELFLV